MKITREILLNILKENFSENSSKKLIVMVNHSPIVLAGVKPAYYCIFLVNGELKFGYVRKRTMADFEITSTFSELQSILTEQTIVKSIGFEESEIPTALVPFADKREVKEIKLMLNSKRFRARAVNFITEDFEPYKSLCNSFNNWNATDSAKAKVVRYAILQQSNTDNFAYFHGCLTGYLSSYVKLHNSVVSNLCFNKETSPIRNIYVSVYKELQDIDEKRITSKELDDKLIQISVPFGFNSDNKSQSEEVVIHTTLSPQKNFVGDADEKDNVYYNVVGMAILDEDYSEEGWSGFPDYRPLYSDYFECLIVNIALYKSLFRNKSESPYNLKFKKIETKGYDFYKPDVNGDISLREIIHGIRRVNGR